ncbi:putative transferase, protein kinase RLK-Pelle-CR4L family [Helianthus annuus]|nr:putative transferase, protein kinase RLK-Pelle-CR4L family [Helianthus annuus]
MIGIARGLTYLHSKKIIHRGVKSSHIFLDKDFNAKLGGFGLVKYCRERSLNTRVMGTIGYAAPEYLSTGRRALDRNRGYGKQNLVDWASKVKLNRRNVKEIMDPGIQHNYPLQGASECFALALRCAAKESKYRPSSEEVLQSLEQIYALSK